MVLLVFLCRRHLFGPPPSTLPTCPSPQHPCCSHGCGPLPVLPLTMCLLCLPHFLVAPLLLRRSSACYCCLLFSSDHPSHTFGCNPSSLPGWHPLNSFFSRMAYAVVTASAAFFLFLFFPGRSAVPDIDAGHQQPPSTVRAVSHRQHRLRSLPRVGATYQPWRDRQAPCVMRAAPQRIYAAVVHSWSRCDRRVALRRRITRNFLLRIFLRTAA